jgi:quinol monooxygenase YgiN
MMVVRHVQYTVKPGKMDEYWRLQEEYAGRFTSREGFGSLKVFVDPKNPNSIFTFAEFDNEQAADSLQESELMKEWGTVLKPLVERWDLYKQYTSCESKSLRPLNE